MASSLITLAIFLAQSPHGELLPALSRTLYPMTERLDWLLYDVRFNVALKVRGKQKPAQKIVIVDIDEKSLHEIGRWPWSRKTVAELTQQLADAKAAVIAFDVVFSEPERNVIEELLQEKTLDPTLANSLDPLKSHYDYDALLANTFAGKDIVLGFIFNKEARLVNTRPQSTIENDSGTADQIRVPEMKGVTANIASLQSHVAGEGFINGPPDNDGVVRRAPLVYRHQNQFYASLALQTVLTYNVVDKATLHTASRSDGLVVTDIAIADRQFVTDEKGNILIPYRGSRGYYPYISATDVLHHRLDTSAIDGAIVLVGTSAVGLFDLRTTPVVADYPGVESQATIIDALLTGDIPYQPDWALAANLLIIAGIFLLLSLVFPLCGPLATMLVGCLVGCAVIALNFWFWMRQGIDLPLAGALAEVLIIFICYLAYGFLFTSRQKKQVQDMFGQYVAPAHINTLMDSPKQLSFEGDTKEMTVMFCDVRNFTTISEGLNANQLKDFLNRYFTPMTEIIFSEQGTIDKYVGDMIMAFWGAPLHDPEHQKHAIATALRMIKKTHEMQEEFSRLGYPPVSIGIGINTGLMNVGDMGSVYRRAYTVLGDAVNLGSRLESITKFYGAHILVSHATLSGIAQEFLCREIDFIQVKGKTEAILVHEPLNRRSEATNDQIELVTRYQRARELFLQRQWSEAKACFRELMVDDPTSGRLYTVYIERCIMYLAVPPDAQWRGIWKHDNK